MMKKLFKIFRGCTFLIILVILIIIVTNIFVPTYVQWRWDSDSTTNSFYELEKDTVDVLVVGPSVSAAAINPMELYKKQRQVSGGSADSLLGRKSSRQKREPPDDYREGALPKGCFGTGRIF